MALSILEQNVINRGCSIAKKLLQEIKPHLDELNAIYDAETIGLKTTITQGDIDEKAAYSGLTKTQLDDGMYVLTSTVKDALNNGLSQLSQLASRAT